jgi:outer membrane protein assembly factor BamB
MRFPRLALLLPIVAAAAAVGADWPQYKGPDRSGISAECGWLAGWPEGGAPRLAWRAAVGKGHSAVSVSGGHAYTMGWDGTKETIHCLEATTGKPIWRQSYSSPTLVQWPGPRSTPTVDGEAVYTLGAHGQLRAWEAKTGKPMWQVELPSRYQPDVDYGFPWSPLAMDDLLIFPAGKAGLAVRKRDGSYAWGNDGQHGASASAVPFQLGGNQGVALLTTNPGRESVSLVAVDPKTGAEQWRYPVWSEKWGAACVDPLILGDKVFVTTAEQHLRCARFSIKDGKLVEDWSNRNLPAYTGNCVVLNGHLYGISKLGRLTCLDWETGGEKWNERGFGTYGSMISADGKLIVQTSNTGEVVVVNATPEGYRELRRTKVFTGPADTFTAPVLANGKLYCRSYAGEVACFELARQ